MGRLINPGMRFNLAELAGSVGDFGTILPLILAVTAAAHLNLSYIFLFFGLWFVICGIYYNLPIPVEPMKAVAVIAIAEGLSGGEIAASGILLGLIFLLLGYGRWLDILNRYIPVSVIRGVQLGLALILLKTSVSFLAGDTGFFLLGLLVITGGFLIARYRGIPDLSSLVLIAIALVIGIIVQGLPSLSFISPPALVIPALPDYRAALTTLVIPQALLTITNAILATSLLTRDLFSAEVRPQNLSKTIGLMNLTAVPFGGLPMCHGAGGLAGQYRFGARTGGANVYAGIILLFIALFFASPAVLNLISGGFYGALLVFVALELGRHSIKTDSWLVTGLIAVLALVIGMTVAFIAGMALAYIIPVIEKRSNK